uniref:NEDD4-binding protein 2-like 1 n=1 Tax=Stomoxys calcitrans TaxID=35570 RepID=A0A1I8NVI5_STOCA
MYANYAETPEQEQVLQKLEEMFYTTPQWQLHQLCVENNWNLELCVSQWMNFVNNANLREKNKTEADPNPATNHPNKETLQICERYQRIGENIKKGYKVLILMRGPPGVGKTYTAHEIVKTFVDLQSPFDHIEDFIFSADDYFYNSKGVYRYNVKYLSEAHEFNQNRVREKAMSGFSPIIVDNTNLKLWEMMPYVKYAVQNGYTIEIVEPKPSWSKCAGKLAQRNIHGVAAEKIRTMMDKYEKGDVPDLMKVN